MKQRDQKGKSRPDWLDYLVIVLVCIAMVVLVVYLVRSQSVSMFNQVLPGL